MSFAPFVADWLGGDEDAPGETPRIAGRLDGESVLAPLLSSSTPTTADQVKVATALARTTGASLSVLDPAGGPGRASKVFSQEFEEDGSELLQWARERVGGERPAGADGFLSTHRLVNGVLRTVATEGIDTLVVPGESPGGGLRKGVTGRIAARADCDTVVVNGRPGYDGVPSILLPVAGGPHSGLAVDVARRIATDCDAWIDVVHVVEADASDRRRETAEEYVAAAASRIDRPETTTWVLEADDAAEAIIEQSGYYGLTVVGAPTKGRLRQFVRGSTNRSIRSSARSVVLSARNGSASGSLDRD